MPVPATAVPSYSESTSGDTDIFKYPVLSLASGSATFFGSGDSNADWFVIDTIGDSHDIGGGSSVGQTLIFTVTGGGSQLELGRRVQTYDDLSKYGANYNSSYFIKGDDATLQQPVPTQAGELTTYRIYHAAGSYQINVKVGANTGGTPTSPAPTGPTPGVNHAPFAVADSVLVEAGQSQRIKILANDYDDDGDALTFDTIGVSFQSAAGVPYQSFPSKGSATFDRASGVLTYKASANASGEDIFTYQISDGHGGTAKAVVLVGIGHYLDPVYRFFDKQTGDHFYTTSAVEKQTIQSTLPRFNYEGVAFAAPLKGAPYAGHTVDVFRFFDSDNGAHFYTASVAERDQVLATVPKLKYEGVAFQSYDIDLSSGNGIVGGAFNLERFFNTQTGQHHFSANQQETDTINQGGAGPGWVDEGRGFVVHTPLDSMLLL